MNRFLFHETDFLAHDLAKLLRQLDISSEAEIDASQITLSEPHAAFPGIFLLYDGRPCAAMGYSREPSATVIVSQPVVLFDATDHVRRNLYDVLLKRMKQSSVEAGFLQMNFLQHDSSVDAIFSGLLGERSFVPAAKILQWEFLTSPRSAVHQVELQNSATPLELRHRDCTVHRFDITYADADEVREIQSALDAILRCSDDLPNQPRPQADELLAKWQSIHASIFACRIQGRIAGILSCVDCTATEPANEFAKACAVESVTESYVSIEYIGVVSEFRRRQLASWLIGQVPLLLHQNGHSVAEVSMSDVTIVRAFSDAANAPATGLYQSRGFVLTAGMQLWCCDLQNEQGGKPVPAHS